MTETPRETMDRCQERRACRKPMECARERDCYFVATVERYYAEELLAVYEAAA